MTPVNRRTMEMIVLRRCLSGRCPCYLIGIYLGRRILDDVAREVPSGDLRPGVCTVKLCDVLVGCLR